MDTIDAKFQRKNPQRKNRSHKCRKNRRVILKLGEERDLILRYSIRASIQSSPVIRYRGQRTHGDGSIIRDPSSHGTRNKKRSTREEGSAWVEWRRRDVLRACTRKIPDSLMHANDPETLISSPSSREERNVGGWRGGDKNLPASDARFLPRRKTLTEDRLSPSLSCRELITSPLPRRKYGLTGWIHDFYCVGSLSISISVSLFLSNYRRIDKYNGFLMGVKYLG